MHGKDLHNLHNLHNLHMGDMTCGVLPAAAPLAIGSLTLAGMALAFSRDGSGRVALSFIGEGGSSLGEWHEAINLCAVRRLSAVFAVENNQTALSTPVSQLRARNILRRLPISWSGVEVHWSTRPLRRLCLQRTLRRTAA
jgi:TPP-dependent pyruvate/acetoin dehydrogenase alpha subunit